MLILLVNFKYDKYIKYAFSQKKIVWFWLLNSKKQSNFGEVVRFERCSFQETTVRTNFLPIKLSIVRSNIENSQMNKVLWSQECPRRTNLSPKIHLENANSFPYEKNISRILWSNRYKLFYLHLIFFSLRFQNVNFASKLVRRLACSSSYHTTWSTNTKIQFRSFYCPKLFH